MSKVLEASCVGGVVTADGVPVGSAQILSEGVGSSQGVLLLDEDLARYIAKTSPDLKTTLERLITALEKIASALTSLDTAGFLIGVTGGAASPAVGIPGTPVAASDIAAITAAKVQLNTLKGMLK